jgi:hypothetical protein
MACELPKSGYVDFRRDGLLLLNKALARQVNNTDSSSGFS